MISIEFSPCGKYLAIISKHQGKIMIHETKDGLESTILGISTDKAPYRTFEQNEIFKTNNKFRFDAQSRFFVVYSEF